MDELAIRLSTFASGYDKVVFNDNPWRYFDVMYVIPKLIENRGYKNILVICKNAVSWKNEFSKYAKTAIYEINTNYDDDIRIVVVCPKRIKNYFKISKRQVDCIITDVDMTPSVADI